VTATRTVAGTVYGFSIAGDLGREVGAMRAATSQIGYLIGSLLGGVALALGGFDALAIVFGGLFVAATLPYVCVRARCRSRATLQPAT
jgi:predicted MFS family arabinose efflux permease